MQIYFLIIEQQKKSLLVYKKIFFLQFYYILKKTLHIKIMKKLIKHPLYSGKKKYHFILILIMAFGHTDLGFSSGSGEHTVYPDTSFRIPAFCLTPSVTIQSVTNTTEGFQDRNKGWQMYSITEFHKDPTTDIIKRKDGYHT